MRNEVSCMKTKKSQRRSAFILNLLPKILFSSKLPLANADTIRKSFFFCPPNCTKKKSWAGQKVVLMLITINSSRQELTNSFSRVAVVLSWLEIKWTKTSCKELSTLLLVLFTCLITCSDQRNYNQLSKFIEWDLCESLPWNLFIFFHCTRKFECLLMTDVMERTIEDRADD